MLSHRISLVLLELSAIMYNLRIAWQSVISIILEGCECIILLFSEMVRINPSSSFWRLPSPCFSEGLNVKLWKCMMDFVLLIIW